LQVKISSSSSSSNICPPIEFPSHLIYSSLCKFHVRITPPLGIPEPGPSFPGNSRVNAPPPLETPRFLNRVGGGGEVRIIIDVVVYKSKL
jgi:hypothetical protein